jgi:transglutaminase-like putative cysteine protease
MLIRIGYEIAIQCPQPTPMIAHLHVHYSRASDLLQPDALRTDPGVPLSMYRDSFGNWCSRLVAPAGRIRLSASTVIRDSGRLEPAAWGAIQHAVDALPEDALLFLLPSRYCESDLLSPIAWNLFGQVPEGWSRVQAVCDFVNQHLTFGYPFSRPTKTAWETYNEGNGVCRDYAHLAIALCRALNIPARYCTAYLGDIGVPPVDAPMDFAGSMEVYLGGSWYAFDPRNNAQRIGRVLIARGRDAADVAITTTFGQHTLEHFQVWTDEIQESGTGASPH